MKNVYHYAVLIVILMIMSIPAFAVTPEELSKGRILQAGACDVNDMQVPCVEVQVGKRTYIMFLDYQYQPVIIFDVTGTANRDLSNSKPVWTRKQMGV